MSTPHRATPAPRSGRLPAAAGRQKMAEVLHVARAHFARFGFQGATVDAIATEAGVTKRTIYAWHTDKVALLLACIQDGAQRLTRPSLTLSHDLREDLRAYAEAVLRVFTRSEGVGLALIFFRSGHKIPAMRTVMRAAIDDHMSAPVAELLRHHGLADAELTGKARLFISMVTGDLQRRLLLGEAPPSEPEIAAHAALISSVFVGGAVNAPQPPTTLIAARDL